MASPSKGYVLIVDDDHAITDLVSDVLTQEGYQVKAGHNAFQGRGLLERFDPDLVILDRKLPDADGLELCQEIRQHPKRRGVPVLFLTSKGSVTEKVVGLKMGADDYLPKPFSTEELVARVQALMRRSKAPAPEAMVLKSGDVAIDLDARKATFKGKPLELGPKEFDLLHAFLESRGRVLTREFLLERVWGYERGLDVTTRVVDVTVSHLRSKLGSSGDRLVTVKNHGYRLEDE